MQIADRSALSASRFGHVTGWNNSRMLILNFFRIFIPLPCVSGFFETVYVHVIKHTFAHIFTRFLCYIYNVWTIYRRRVNQLIQLAYLVQIRLYFCFANLYICYCQNFCLNIYTISFFIYNYCLSVYIL